MKSLYFRSFVVSVLFAHFHSKFIRKSALTCSVAVNEKVKNRLVSYELHFERGLHNAVCNEEEPELRKVLAKRLWQRVSTI